jgi:hypothetical protein
MNDSSRFRTVTSPHGTLVHFDYLNDGRTDDVARGTSCGRKVPATWTTETADAATVVQRVTCPGCAAWARYHHAEELVAAAHPGMVYVGRAALATDAANSATRYAELVAHYAPAAPVEHAVEPAQVPSSSPLAAAGRQAVRRLNRTRRSASMVAAVRSLPPAGTVRLC